VGQHLRFVPHLPPYTEPNSLPPNLPSVTITNCPLDDFSQIFTDVADFRGRDRVLFPPGDLTASCDPIGTNPRPSLVGMQLRCWYPATGADPYEVGISRKTGRGSYCD